MDNQTAGKFICNFEGCDRQYQNVKVFQKHLRKKHADFLSLSEHSEDEEPDNVLNIAEVNNFNEIRKKILMNGQRTGKFICNFEGCDRQYQNMNAFEKHLRKKHSALFSLNEHNIIEEQSNENISQYVASEQGHVNLVINDNDEVIDFNEVRKEILMNGQRTGKFICNFEGCDRQYQNENAFKKHLRKKHFALFSLNKPNPNEEQLDEDSFQNVSTEQTHVNQEIVFDVEPLKTDVEAINDLKSTALTFLSNMHSKPSINRLTVTDIFRDVKNEVLSKVCKEIRSKVEYTQFCDNDQKNDLLNFVNSCSKICDHVDTEYKFVNPNQTKTIYCTGEEDYRL